MRYRYIANSKIVDIAKQIGSIYRRQQRLRYIVLFLYDTSSIQNGVDIAPIKHSSQTFGFLTFCSALCASKSYFTCMLWLILKGSLSPHTTTKKKWICHGDRSLYDSVKTRSVTIDHNKKKQDYILHFLCHIIELIQVRNINFFTCTVDKIVKLLCIRLIAIFKYV